MEQDSGKKEIRESIEERYQRITSEVSKWDMQKERHDHHDKNEKTRQPEKIQEKSIDRD